MKIFRSVLLLCLILSLSVSSSFFVAAVNAQAGASSQNATPVVLAQLKKPVTVRRDERGIPYIEAANEDDLYFVQGYVTASDRLWQMDLTRRAARGELAEIFGRVALEEDQRRRVYGLTALSE